jgi:hypothetical protein
MEIGSRDEEEEGIIERITDEERKVARTAPVTT